MVVWDGDGREQVRFSFPRQRRDRRLCIADFFRPISSGEPDVIGMHVVTMGLAASEATAKLFADNRYREYLELHGVTVEMAEALAEYWHQRVRQELGIAGDDAADMEDLFDQGYRGSRYSFGYPACPDLEEQTKLFELLGPERIGVELSEEFQLHPEQSTSAIIVHPPGGQVLQREVNRGRRKRAAVRVAAGPAAGASAQARDDRADRRRGHRPASRGRRRFSGSP